MIIAVFNTGKKLRQGKMRLIPASGELKIVI